jgi:hypothetical protein
LESAASVNGVDGSDAGEEDGVGLPVVAVDLTPEDPLEAGWAGAEDCVRVEEDPADSAVPAVLVLPHATSVTALKITAAGAANLLTFQAFGRSPCTSGPRLPIDPRLRTDSRGGTGGKPPWGTHRMRT